MQEREDMSAWEKAFGPLGTLQEHRKHYEKVEHWNMGKMIGRRGTLGIHRKGPTIIYLTGVIKIGRKEEKALCEGSF